MSVREWMNTAAKASLCQSLLTKHSLYNVLFLLALLSSLAYHAVEGCTSQVFKLLAEDQHLGNSLIYEREMESLLDCTHSCLSENPQCKSINFEKGDKQHYKRKKCQLNNETKSTKPKELVFDTAFNYFEPIQPFDSNDCVPCKNGGTCSGNPNQCSCLPGFAGQRCEKVMRSCEDWFNIKPRGKNKDGVYAIDPDGFGSFNVSCNMITDGGGWTVFQRRIDGSVNFYRGWNEYKNGFGNMSGEFWLGLDKIHRLTKNNKMELRVDMEDFEGGNASVTYKIFKVDAENRNYKLTVGGYTGPSNCRISTTDGHCCVFPTVNGDEYYFSCITSDNGKSQWCATTNDYNRNKKWGNCTNQDVGDSLSHHSGMMFSTNDKDNDKETRSSCAVEYKGAWWYKHCHTSNLNGEYRQDAHSNIQGSGVCWTTWKGYYYSLMKTEVKIRPQKS